MDDLKDEYLTEEQEKNILKDSITTIVENYKMLLMSNNKITKDERQKYYDELNHSVTIIEFITKCDLDDGVLWRGIESPKN